LKSSLYLLTMRSASCAKALGSGCQSCPGALRLNSETPCYPKCPVVFLCEGGGDLLSLKLVSSIDRAESGKAPETPRLSVDSPQRTLHTACDLQLQEFELHSSISAVSTHILGESKVFVFRSIQGRESQWLSSSKAQASAPPFPPHHHSTSTSPRRT